MTVQFTVSDMACSACVETITKAIQAIDPQAQINANLSTKALAIETQQPETLIKQTIVSAGYTVA
jgi:copper chaperone